MFTLDYAAPPRLCPQHQPFHIAITFQHQPTSQPRHLVPNLLLAVPLPVMQIVVQKLLIFYFSFHGIFFIKSSCSLGLTRVRDSWMGSTFFISLKITKSTPPTTDEHTFQTQTHSLLTSQLLLQLPPRCYSCKSTTMHVSNNAVT